ncbi:multiple epidermal growth factor-like domains protein 10, partial [Ptychodera flava]|uniref:multiple epidermal growth factor-like domains protein 10 n=1 Tax=Ptychodera flava TaxID=63121 RepID=UPI00396A1D99
METRTKGAMIVLLTLCIAAHHDVTSADFVLPVQTHADDPNACLLFSQPNGDGYFTCCRGFFKNDSANLMENCRECPDGVYGTNCQSKCRCRNGALCSNIDGSCACPEYYFGALCDMSCNCKNGATCDKIDGFCQCQEGFYGDLCQSECTCPTNSLCKGGECVCKAGYYGTGNSCQRCNCSVNEMCDSSTGRCTCKPGYYAERCEKRCSCFNGATCFADSCICSQGWVGPNCTVCDKNWLVRSDRPFCEDRCLHCFNGDTCSPQDGSCHCTPGWQGNKCDRRCDVGFYGNNCSEPCRCVNGSCHHITGTCTCERGWTGEYCDRPCPENCILCSAHACTSCKPGWTGVNCTSHCQLGHYGDGCRERCPKCHCSDSCHHVDGSCQNVDRCVGIECVCKNGGTCLENPFSCECTADWNGTYCDQKIPTTQNYGLLENDASLGRDETELTNKSTGVSDRVFNRDRPSAILITAATLTALVAIVMV